MADFRNTSCRVQAWLNPVLFTTSSSAHGDSAPSQDKWQPWGFHSKSRQNLLWKYWNLLTMGLTCQLSFHCLIYASKEFLGKSFKLQFTSSPHLAQSLHLGKCFVLARYPGWTLQMCPRTSLCLVSLLDASRQGPARAQSFCIVLLGLLILPASYPGSPPTGTGANNWGIPVTKMGAPKQALCTSPRSQDTFDEGG